MFIFELTNTEDHPVYEQLATDNLARQYDFLRSIVRASLELGRPMLSIEVIKALNYHAISCLHFSPGQFRPCEVRVGEYQPPAHYQVSALMQMFTNEVNRNWEAVDPVLLATMVLWRLNHIHPFINGNGRTARVTAYMVLCLKLGAWLPGTELLPERIRARREDYVAALRHADGSFGAGALDLAPLHRLVTELLDAQINGYQPD
jgi:hypothetical protein